MKFSGENISWIKELIWKVKNFAVQPRAQINISIIQRVYLWFQVFAIKIKYLKDLCANRFPEFVTADFPGYFDTNFSAEKFEK